MNDSRRYSRLNTNVICTLYALNSFEFPARILNLSEVGVLIEVDYSESLFNVLRIGDYVFFQGVDNFEYLGIQQKRIFQEKSKVVRIESTGNTIRIACNVSGTDENYKQYVTELKTADFVNKMHGK